MPPESGGRWGDWCSGRGRWDARNKDTARLSMVMSELRILQANLGRREEAQNGLHNDPELRDFHLILGQEPRHFRSEKEVVVTGTNPRWTLLKPSKANEAWPHIRSCLWVRKDVTHTQVEVLSPDITAAVITTTEKRRIFVASTYVPGAGWRLNEGDHQQDLRKRLLLISGAYLKEKQIWLGTEILEQGISTGTTVSGEEVPLKGKESGEREKESSASWRNIPWNLF